MGTKDSQQGFDDAKNGDHYEPPHRQGIIGEFIHPNSPEKIQDNKDYREGWREGREYHERNRK